MQVISKYNKGFLFFYVSLIFFVNEHGLFLWKTKKVLQIPILLKKIYESNCKLNKIWVNKNSEFYNRSIKSWLPDNDGEMYSRRIKEKICCSWKICWNLKEQNLRVFDIMQFDNMLQKCFNCSYRSSTQLPTRIIETSTHWTFTCLKSAIETLNQGVKSVQN